MILRWIALTTTMVLIGPVPEAGDWDGLVKKYVEAYESVKEPVPTAYPWVAKRLRIADSITSRDHDRLGTAL